MRFDFPLADLRRSGVASRAQLADPSGIGFVVVDDAFGLVGANGLHGADLAHDGLVVELGDHATNGRMREQVAAVRIATGLHGLALVGLQGIDLHARDQLEEAALVMRVAIDIERSRNRLALALELGAHHEVEALDLRLQILVVLAAAGAGRAHLGHEVFDHFAIVGELVHGCAESSELGFEIADGLAVRLGGNQGVVGFLELGPGLALLVDQGLDFQERSFAEEHGAGTDAGDIFLADKGRAGKGTAGGDRQEGDERELEIAGFHSVIPFMRLRLPVRAAVICAKSSPASAPVDFLMRAMRVFASLREKPPASRR